MQHPILCGTFILWAGLAISSVYGSDSLVNRAIEPQAEFFLKRMTEYLNSLEQFTVHAENTEDQMLSSGQKIQFGWAVDVALHRPNRLRASVKGDLHNQDFFYDGQTITIWETTLNLFGTLKAPSNIEAALNYALESFGLRAPLADLIRDKSFHPIPEYIESADYVGLHDVHGIKCHHLAIRQDDIDWQIWIEDSATPLPRKIIITQKHVTGAPQFSALLFNWNVAPQLPDSRFIFVRPDKAKEIEFLPANSQAFLED